MTSGKIEMGIARSQLTITVETVVMIDLDFCSLLVHEFDYIFMLLLNFNVFNCFSKIVKLND